MKQLPKILPAFLILIVGICLSFWINFMYKSAALNQKQNQINFIIEEHLKTIQIELTMGISSVKLLSYLFEVQKTVSKEEFKNYTASLFKGNNGIKALSWVPKITDKERVNFEKQTSKTLHTDFVITEQNSQNEIITRQTRAIYFPVTYIEPINDNKMALGYDIHSDSTRHQTIDFAISKGAITLTSRLKIVQDTSGYSYLGIMPVFYAPEKPKTINNVKGLISAVFKVDKMIKKNFSILKDSAVALIIFDITNHKKDYIFGNKSLLYTDKQKVEKRILNFGDRTLELNFYISPDYFQTADNWMLLFSGIFISFLLSLILLFPFLKEQHFKLLSNRLKEANQEKDLTQQSLAESQAFFKTLFNYIPDGIFIATPKGKYIEVNKAASKLLGYSHDELIQLNIRDIITESETSRVIPELEAILKSPLGNRKWVFKRKDLSTFPGLVYSTQLPNGNILGIVQDITERKHFIENLRQYEHIVSSSSDMLALFDKNYTYLTANNSYAVNFNKSIAQIVGKTPKQLFGEAFFIKVIKPYADRCLNGESVNFKEWVDFGNQNRLYMDVHYHPYYNKSHEILGFIVNARDITPLHLVEVDLKKYAASWQTTFDAMTDSVCLLDLDHKITQYNQATLTMFNIDANSFKDLHCHDLVHCASSPIPGCPFVKMKLSKTHESLEFFQDNKWYKVSVDPIFDDQKELIGGVHVVSDITQRKQAEENLKSSEVRYRCLFESAKDGILILDADTGMIKDVNPFLVALLGYSYDVFLEKKIWEIGLFKDIIANQDNFFELQQKEYIRYKNLPLETSDGRTINVEFVSNVYLVDQKKVIQCNIRDNTERLLAEKALEESEELLRLSTELANVAAWEMDLVNDSMTRSRNHDNLYGLTGVGQWHVNTFMDATHINDREKCNTLIYQSVAAGGPDQYKFDFRILYPDKSIHWLNVIGEVIERDAQGVGTKLRGFLTDITDRKEAEEALKNYTKRLSNLNNLNSGILAAKTVKEISANTFQFLEEVVDYKFATLSQIDVTNKTYTRVAMHNKASLKEFYFDDKPVPFSKLDLIDYEMLASGKPQFCNDIKTIKVTSDNHKKLLQENINSFLAVPLITEDNLVGGLAVFCENDQVFTDKNIEIVQELANQLAIAINQKKLHDEIIQHSLELENKVAERTAQLEYTNNELRDFAQVVSHDLKAPLRAISQLSFWLSKDYADKLDEVGQNQLSLIISRTKRLDDLIEGILQYSRAGKLLEKEVEINFNTVVKNCIIALNPPKHIKITIDNKLPNYKADKTRMAQLFQNLINNAIKYNNKPIGAIHIGCKTKKGFYEFYVSDNGIGIEEQYFDRIFQIFQRLESRDVQEGTGIGLSLVKRIVQIYGGEVNLTSKIGEGSTFFFTLPIINEIA